MEFCIISPTAGLERYAKLSKTHLVLAQVFERDTEYHKFYVDRRAEDDLIILDNGAYETGVPVRPSPQMLSALRPHVVVLPDYPLQPWKKTWHAAIAYLDSWTPSEFILGPDFLYIPQAQQGDLHGFIESYQEATRDSRITWIGIPRSLAYAITDNPLARVEFARMVRKDHPSIKLHAFGMVNGDVHELPYLAAAGVTSVDSSAPVWRGWNGYHIKGTEESLKQVGLAPWASWPGTQVDFNAKLDERTDVTIMCNLEACGVRISTGERTAVQGQDVAYNPSVDDGSISF